MTALVSRPSSPGTPSCDSRPDPRAEDLGVFAQDDASGIDLVTQRLRLREPRRADLSPLHEAIVETLPDLVRWLPWARRGHTRLDTRRYLRGARAAWTRRTAFEFVVEELDGSVVGITSLHRIDWTRRCAGLGYWVRASCQNRGYAREAAEAAVTHGLHALALNRIEVHVAVGNEASHAVVNALGFHREGVARDAEFVDGRYLDHVQYSVLRRDDGSAV